MRDKSHSRRENLSSPTAKRQRLHEPLNSVNSRYEELDHVRHARLTGDVLASPAICTSFDHIIQSLTLSKSQKCSVESALLKVKQSIDALPPRQQSISLQDPLVLTALRNFSYERSTSLSAWFHSPLYKNISMSFEPPTNVNVVGSFLLGFASTPVVDLAIQMPSAIFKSKDYLNFRYHDKRLLYLLYFAHQLQTTVPHTLSNFSLKSFNFACDKFKPTLSVSVVGIPNVTVRIIPTLPSDTFDTKRLSDKHNNLRPSGSSSLVQSPELASCDYNHSILADMAPLANLKALHSVSSMTPHFTSTVLLLHAWNVRHRLGLSKFVFAVLLADLLSRSVLPHHAPREQMLRCAFGAIRSGQLSTLSLNGVRVCASVKADRLERIAESAASALRLIESDAASDDPWYGVIPFLFATARGTIVDPHPLSTLFDGFLKVAYQNDPKGLAAAALDEKVRDLLKATFIETRRLTRIEALGDGLFGLTFKSHEDVVRKVDTRDMETDAVVFNDFWGEKSSLRRFKDGRIVEALVWSGGMQTLGEMATYVFEKHFGGIVTCKVVVGELERAAKLSDSTGTMNRAIAAFNELSTVLRSIEGLPLRIRDVHGTSAHLRRCGMYSIRPNGANLFSEALDVVASFESSKAWPKDAVALAASKAAFYIALKDKLAEKGVSSLVTISFLDITVSGFVFRLRLRVEQEAGVLEEQAKGDKLRWETESLVRHHDDVRSMQSSIMGQVCRLAKRWLNAHMLLGCLGDRGDVLVELLVMAVMGSNSGRSCKSSMQVFCSLLELIAEFPWEVCALVVPIAKTGEDDREAESLWLPPGWSRALRDAEKMRGETKRVLDVYVARDGEVRRWCDDNVTDIDAAVVKRIHATATASLEFVEEYVQKCGVEEGNEGMSLETIFTAGTDGIDAIVRLDERACVMSSKSREGPLASGRRGALRSGTGVAAGLDAVERVCERFKERLGAWAIVLHPVRSGSNMHIVWRKTVSQTCKLSLRAAAFSDIIAGAADGTAASLQPSVGQLVEEIECAGEGLVAGVDILTRES